MEQVYMTTNIITKSKDEWVQSVKSRPYYDSVGDIATITDPVYFMTAPYGVFDGKPVISRTTKFDGFDDVNKLFANENIALYDARHSKDLDGSIVVKYADISVEREGIPLNDFLKDFKNADGTESDSRFKYSTIEGIQAQVDGFDNDDKINLIFVMSDIATGVRIEKSVYFNGMIYAQ
jgi:hypothetical protein